MAEMTTRTDKSRRWERGAPITARRLNIGGDRVDALARQVNTLDMTTKFVGRGALTVEVLGVFGYMSVDGGSRNAFSCKTIGVDGQMTGEVITVYAFSGPDLTKAEPPGKGLGQQRLRDCSPLRLRADPPHLIPVIKVKNVPVNGKFETRHYCLWPFELAR